MAGEGRSEGGATGSRAHSRLQAGRTACPLAQAHSTARVPAFLPTRARTQRAGGKARNVQNVRSGSWSGAAWSGLSGSEPGSPALLSGAGWGATLHWFARPPSPAVAASRAGIDAQDAGAGGRVDQAPPFSLARCNGGAGRSSSGRGGGKIRGSPRRSLSKLSLVRAFKAGG